MKNRFLSGQLSAWRRRFLAIARAQKAGSR
jgi:hypothetical protein